MKKVIKSNGFTNISLDATAHVFDSIDASVAFCMGMSLDCVLPRKNLTCFAVRVQVDFRSDCDDEKYDLYEVFNFGAKSAILINKSRFLTTKEYNEEMEVLRMTHQDE